VTATGGGAESSANDKAALSSRLSRALVLSGPNLPVIAAHSHTALPRSSNLTQPVLLVVTGATRRDDSAPLSWALKRLFAVVLLMAPFVRDGLANLNPHVRKLEDQSQSKMILRTKHRQGGFAVVPLAPLHPPDGLGERHAPNCSFNRC
jgi:hypothetical protein